MRNRIADVIDPKLLDEAPAASGALTVSDEGVALSTTVGLINFAGAGVTASGSGADITVTVPGYALRVIDEAVTITETATSLRFQGAGVTATNSSGNVTITVPGSPLAVSDEGNALTSAATGLNFVGAGVTASHNAGLVTITIPGATGGLASVQDTPPVNPSLGQLWFKDNTGQLFIRESTETWFQIAGGGPPALPNNVAYINQAQQFTQQQRKGVTTLTPGASVTLNASLNNLFRLVLSQAVTSFTVTNLQPGTTFSCEFLQPGVGSGYAVGGWSDNLSLATGAAISTTLGSVSVLQCESFDGYRARCSIHTRVDPITTVTLSTAQFLAVYFVPITTNPIEDSIPADLVNNRVANYERNVAYTDGQPFAISNLVLQYGAGLYLLAPHNGTAWLDYDITPSSTPSGVIDGSGIIASRLDSGLGIPAGAVSLEWYEVTTRSYTTLSFSVALV